mmetsp:Transcript_69890/g.198358  ORF Transcript_69890/g.198358 Transcript_69890/m.198358 type:complete len:206 (-) Transcript_69890:1375-1992(-)
MLSPFTAAPTPMAAPRRVIGSVFFSRATSRRCRSVSVAFSLSCFMSGGITFTIAFCTECVEVGSCKRCNKRGKISGSFSWSGGRCFESAPRKTATPSFADSLAARPTPLSSKLSTAPKSTSECSSPCFSISVMPAASSTSRSAAASGVPSPVRPRACTRIKRNAFVTCSSSMLPARTFSRHRATNNRASAFSLKSWVRSSSAVPT